MVRHLMKITYTLLLLATGVWGQPALVSHGAASSIFPGVATISQKSTVGATAIFLFDASTYGTNNVTSTPTDSLSNKWTPLYNSGYGSAWACFFPLTSTNHSFSMVNNSTGADNGQVLTMLAFGGTLGSIDASSTATGYGENSLQLPTISPTAPGDLIMTLWGGVAALGTLHVDSGFVLVDQTSSTGFGVTSAGTAWQVQPAPGSVSPTWGGYTSGDRTLAIVVAVKSAGTVAPTPIVVPPTPTIGGGRTVGGVQFFPPDYYFNSPVDRLPLDPQSANKVAALGPGRLGPDYEFHINLATNATPVPAIVWDQSTGETDAGNYPIGPTTQVSNWNPTSSTNNVSDYIPGCNGCGFGAGPEPSGDGHVLVFNTDNKFLYETAYLQNNAPPYHFGNGAVWDVTDYRLRTATKLIPDIVDSDGMTSGDAAGMPISPLIFSYAEVHAGQPILHGVRMTLTAATQTSAGYKWPATHAAGGKTNSGIYMGETFRLTANFDTVTCHNADNDGLPYPASFQQVLIALKTYGMYFADNGLGGLIGMDNDLQWGDNGPTSEAYIVSGWLHCVLFSNLEVVDNQPRIVNITSGQVNQNFVPR